MSVERRTSLAVLLAGIGLLAIAAVAAMSTLPFDGIGGDPSSGERSNRASSVALPSPSASPSMSAGQPTIEPSPPRSAAPTAQPLPPFHELHVVDPGRLTALVDGIQPLGDGRFVAAVNASNWESMPATGPHGMSGSIHVGSLDGGWQLVDTGDLFQGVEFKALFKAPDARFVVYGELEGYDATIGVGFTSTDGRSWEQFYELPWASIWDARLAAGPQGYLAVVNSTDPEHHRQRIRAYRSADAVTWTLAYEALETDDHYAYAVGVGSEGYVIAAARYLEEETQYFTIASSDGDSWITSSDDQPFVDARTPLFSITAFGPDWVAAGFPAEGQGIPVYFSANGLDWTHVATIEDPADREYFGYAAHLVSTDDRLFLSAAFQSEGTESQPAGTWTSTDGRTWSMLPIGGRTEVRAVVGGGDRIVFGGRVVTVTAENPGASGVIWSADEDWFP